MFVLAHPLHANWPPDRSRQKRGIARRVLVAVTAIAPRSVDIDTTDLLFGHRQHRSQLLPQGMRCLRCAPTRECSILELDDGTRRANRSMRLNGKIIARTQSSRAPRQGRSHLAYVAGDILFHD